MTSSLHKCQTLSNRGGFIVCELTHHAKTLFLYHTAYISLCAAIQRLNSCFSMFALHVYLKKHSIPYNIYNVKTWELMEKFLTICAKKWGCLSLECLCVCRGGCCLKSEDRCAKSTDFMRFAYHKNKLCSSSLIVNVPVPMWVYF